MQKQQRTSTSSSSKSGTNNPLGSSQDKEKGDPRACLFVASLNSALSDSELVHHVTRHFSPYGPLKSVKVLKDSSNRPYAFIQFLKATDAEQAMRLAQHSTLNDRKIRIERAHVNRTLLISAPDASPLGTIEDVRRQMCEEFGQVEEVIPKGTGVLVKFAYREDAVDAFAALRTRQGWSVRWASASTSFGTPSVQTGNLPTPPTSPRVASDSSVGDRHVIFIGNLDADKVNASMVVDKFSEYGEIVESSYFVKNIGRFSYAFAFVKYETEESATRAIRFENGHPWYSRPVRVELKHGGRHASTTSATSGGGRSRNPSYLSEGTNDIVQMMSLFDLGQEDGTVAPAADTPVAPPIMAPQMAPYYIAYPVPVQYYTSPGNEYEMGAQYPFPVFGYATQPALAPDMIQQQVQRPDTIVEEQL